MLRADPELTYRAGFFGKERYILHESDLLVSVHGPTRSSDYSVELRQINPRYVRHRQVPLGWAAVAVACALATAALIAWAVRSDGPGDWIFILAGALVTFIGLVAGVVQFVHYWQDAVLFYDAYGGPGFLSLRWQKPDPQTFQSFVAELQARIERQHEQADGGALAAELTGLDRLKHDGALSDQEYRAAKAKLLGLEPWQLG